ncbi:protein phosphatase 1 regulatory subunit 37 [Ischnura elegans]|uniref:protein phosphatase 1 regulatory subunit 37 n=1 Tax=Ischnura elegans TaxID=197161 RepID=UPI001ED8A09A|nr:protein phosphatase 1 regulatory subunit 37 [Ischnura elegans]
MSEGSSAFSDSQSDSASTLDDVSQASSHQSTSDQNSTRKVCFPEEERNLVTGYLEPPDPWQYAQSVTQEEVVACYKWSCRRHGSEPLTSVLQQLKGVEDGGGRGVGGLTLDLAGERLEQRHCEPLEEVLKRVQFDTISLEGSFLEDEASVAMFDMVEYYEAAKQLNISSNDHIGPRGWQACSQMLKKTRCLEKLVARNTKLSEQQMPTLCRGLRIGTNLQALHLENCGLSGRSVAILVNALKTNTSLKELHLADNGLGVADALHIRDLLRVNSTLQLLDVSNNCMQDKGVGHLCDGLVDQAIQHGHYSNLLRDLSAIGGGGSVSGSGQQAAAPAAGLSVLILWNNQLTKNSAFSIYKLIANSKTLDTLNVGRNMLTSESILQMKAALQQSCCLGRLGLQSTCISCEGAVALAECIAVNCHLQRIDLRDNPIQIGGLMALARSMKEYTGVTRIDLDDAPKRPLDGGEEALQQYVALVREIREYSEHNAREGRSVKETSQPVQRVVLCPTTANLRKISLTCETLMRGSPPCDDMRKGCWGSGLLQPMEARRLGCRLRSPAPSPIPSPSPSPTPSPHSSPVPSPSSRFHVSRVPDPPPPPPPPPLPPSSPSSRFKVTLVSEPPPTLVTTSTGNVTIGFKCQQDCVTPAPPCPSEASWDFGGGEQRVEEGEQSIEASPFSVPGRIRKFSSVTPPRSLEPEQPKNASSLERLLGLFQKPSSIFSKGSSSCSQNGLSQVSLVADEALATAAKPSCGQQLLLPAISSSSPYACTSGEASSCAFQLHQAPGGKAGEVHWCSAQGGKEEEEGGDTHDRRSAVVDDESEGKQLC